ncbi:hypothetical protein GQ54DRAFT_308723, partial [Martensiomyces pterosporus]
NVPRNQEAGPGGHSDSDRRQRRHRRQHSSSNRNRNRNRSSMAQSSNQQPPAARHAYSASDLQDPEDRSAGAWSSYYQAEPDDGNWGSSGSDLYDYSARRQTRNQQPLLKKST